MNKMSGERNNRWFISFAKCIKKNKPISQWSTKQKNSLLKFFSILSSKQNLNQKELDQLFDSFRLQDKTFLEAEKLLSPKLKDRNHFEIIRTLGEGSFGKVFQVKKNRNSK